MHGIALKPLEGLSSGFPSDHNCMSSSRSLPSKVSGALVRRYHLMREVCLSHCKQLRDDLEPTREPLLERSMRPTGVDFYVPFCKAISSKLQSTIQPITPYIEKTQKIRRAVAMQLPCSCHAVAMQLPCSCHAWAMLQPTVTATQSLQKSSVIVECWFPLTVYDGCSIVVQF